MKPFPFSYLLNPSMEEVTIYGQSHIATADAVYETDIARGTHYSINAVSQTPDMLERDDPWQAVAQSGDSLTDLKKDSHFLLLNQYSDVFGNHQKTMDEWGRLSIRFTPEMLPLSDSRSTGSHHRRKRKSPNFNRVCCPKGSSSHHPVHGSPQLY